MAELLGPVPAGDVVVAEGRPHGPAGPEPPVGVVELAGEQLGIAPLIDVVAGGDQRVHPEGGRPALHRPGHRRLGRAAAEVAQGDQAGADRPPRRGGRGRRRRLLDRGLAVAGTLAAGHRPQQGDDAGQQDLPAGQGPAAVGLPRPAHRRAPAPGRMRTCRWSSWLARVMTTFAGPRRPVRGPTNTYWAPARTNRSTSSWARRRSIWATRAGTRSRPSRRG